MANGTRCQNCGQSIHCEPYSDGSQDWEHDVPEDDCDGRVCLLSATDNSWAVPA